MMRNIFILFVIICFSSSCVSDSKPSTASSEPVSGTAPAASDAPVSNWKQLTPSAGYSKAHSYQLFAQGDQLYAFNVDGVWVSKNGSDWSKTGLSDLIKNQTFMDYVAFNGAVYALGTFSGGIAEHEITSQIARTTDFKTWEIIARKSNLPPRFLYHPVVFQNKIWIFGGNDGITIYDDAWNSTDGIKWQRVAEGLPFGARHSQDFVVFKDQLYMLSNDVWRSKDGINWEQVTSRIAADDIVGYTPVVFDDKIWLIGARGNGKAGSIVRYSEDGSVWKTMTAPWLPRMQAAVGVFKDQLIITGGKYGGSDSVPSDQAYFNDVWALRQ